MFYNFSILAGSTIYGQQDETCKGKQTPPEKFCFAFAINRQNCESTYLLKKDRFGYVRRCVWDETATIDKHRCRAASKPSCKPFDWSTAKIHEGKRCSKSSWRLKDAHLKDAEQRCDEDPNCKGLQYFKRDGVGAREAKRGRFKGCAGNVSSVVDGKVTCRQMHVYKCFLTHAPGFLCF